MRLNRHILFLLFFIPLLALSQKDTDELFFRADSLINDGKFSEAIDAYLIYISVEKEQDTVNWSRISESYNNIGVAYYYTRDYIEAANAFEEGLAIDRIHLSINIPTRLSNLGMVYSKQGNYLQAIEYYMEALELAEVDNDKENTSIILNNIGAVYDAWGEYDKAIDYYQRSLRIKEEMGNRQGISNSLNNIGLVFSEWKKYDQAIANFKEALEIDMELGHQREMATRFNNIGLVYYKINNYDSALFYYRKALELNSQLGNLDQVTFQYNNIGMIYIDKADYATAKYYLELSLSTARELNLKADLTRVLSNLGYAYGMNGEFEQGEQYILHSLDLARELNLLQQEKVNYHRLSEIYEAKGDSRLALEYFKKSRVIEDSLFNREMHEQIADFEVKYESERKQKEIELLKQREIISSLEARRARIVRNSLIAGLLLILVLVGVIYWSLRQRTRDNRLIAFEKGKSDKLLLNIFPTKIATDLKETGTTNPESFDNVTVFFSDLVDFTRLSSELEPEFIINELNQIFTKIDSIMEKNGCERIKTIGDAYMAVCGLPEPDGESPVKILKAACEVLDFMKERQGISPVKWEARIGVHTGRVVAGVVGVKKYIYDVFGDTVNVASRMEAHSESMMINVSEETYQIVKDKFEFIERQPIEIKGKGSVKMYFLKR